MNTNAIPNNRTDPRTSARALFYQGWKISDISRHLNISAGTIYAWKKRDNWEGGSALARVTSTAETRAHQLIMLPDKSDRQINELKGLFNMFERAERAQQQSGQNMPIEGSDANYLASTKRDTKKKPEKNYLSPEVKKRIHEIFMDNLFGYQKNWYQNKHQRIRNILKSRQIGATYYLAREALDDTINTNKNKIFISASKAQSYNSKRNIINVAKQAGADLSGGDTIVLADGQELHFVGTNSRTAQGYNGDTYIDEYAWIPKFLEFRKVAGAMASQSHYTLTYSSTASYTSHESHAYWTGDFYNKARPKNERVNIDLSPELLKNGFLCPDGQWRHLITVETAIEQGCNRLDLNQLKFEYTPEEFEQLFRCVFLALGDSVFNLDSLQALGIDSWIEWADFYKPLEQRPLGNIPVWLSYDPTKNIDAAGLVIIMPPTRKGEKFRIIENVRLYGNDYQAQADIIKKYTETFNVEKIIIDETGIGSAVLQIVQGFFPFVIGVNYNLEIKAMMVLKMLNVIKHKRLEFDAGNSEFIMSMLGIKRDLTPKSKQITYVADRSEETGHSDIAWAVMQAIIQEPIDESIDDETTLEFL